MMMARTVMLESLMIVLVAVAIMVMTGIMMNIRDHIAEQHVMMLAAMRGHVLDIRHGAGRDRLDKHQHQGRAQHGSGFLK